MLWVTWRWTCEFGPPSASFGGGLLVPENQGSQSTEALTTYQDGRLSPRRVRLRFAVAYASRHRQRSYVTTQMIGYYDI
jgi:hypothetical protein